MLVLFTLVSDGDTPIIKFVIRRPVEVPSPAPGNANCHGSCFYGPGITFLGRKMAR